MATAVLLFLRFIRFGGIMAAEPNSLRLAFPGITNFIDHSVVYVIKHSFIFVMTKPFSVVMFIALLVVCLPANAACNAIGNTARAERIAKGHAWFKHKSEFLAGTVIAGLAMPSTPKVTTIPEFKSLILSVISSTTSKPLLNGRIAYWGASTGTIVVYDPASNDCGTSFRPVDGKPYYNRQ